MNDTKAKFEVSLEKLPLITLAFWITKITATTLGETGGDLLSMTLNMGYALSSLVFISFFILTLALQLFSTHYRPFIYWLVILSTSTAGTTMSDYMDRSLGLGYAAGSTIIALMLACVLLAWRLSGYTFAVEKIKGFKPEVFYWTAVLFSNTLGTALGDFLADDSGLGFAGGAVLIGAAICLIIVLKGTTRLSSTVLFWVAFVLTRPFGATAGDVLTKSPEKGGLGFGTIGTSAILAFILLVCVALDIRAQLHKRKRTQTPAL